MRILDRNERGDATDPTARTVAITGGARGIGLATARRIVGLGGRVVLGDVDEDLCAKAAIDLGPAAIGLPLDVTDRESFEGFLDAAADEFGGIDVLVNNAGIMPLGPLLDEPDDVTRRVVEVNLLGVITGIKAGGARMAARGAGHIVNVASAAGRVGLPHAATYSATKHAVVGLTEATRAELGPRGVDVSAVLPMIVNTELGAGLAKLRGQPTLEAEDVARAITRVIARPRFETWVPRRSFGLYRSMQLLPRSWGEWASRIMGAADVLATPDTAARAEYERRIRI